MSFNFNGHIPASKSILSRLLLSESFITEESVSPFFTCDDVIKMSAGIKQLFAGDSVDCGDSATALRSLVLRASRIPGRHFISGSERLMARPHSELSKILNQLQVRVNFFEKEIIVESTDWPDRDLNITVDRSLSSQFASALLLNGWMFAHSLRISWSGETVSDGYWQMSLKLAQKLGMKFKLENNSVTVLPSQKPFIDWTLTEADMSSAFSVAALATVSGQARIKDFPLDSLQPDSVFLEVLKKMGVNAELENGDLLIKKATDLKPVSFDLVNCPDMFPVLSVLCAFADGKSHLFGAAHLAHKESHRIHKTAELIRLMGRKCEETLDGMIIHGQKQNRDYENLSAIIFDPDRDHRLVMAAGVAKAAGLNVLVTDPRVVRKSFPDFLEISHL